MTHALKKRGKQYFYLYYSFSFFFYFYFDDHHLLSHFDYSE